LSKAWVLFVLDLPRLGSVPLLGPINLSMVWNRGVSFGLFRADHEVMRWALAAFSLGVALILAGWARKLTRPRLAVALGLIMGGAVGNLIDRVRFGAVCDFIDFSALYFLNQKDAMFFAISIAFAGFCNDLTMGATWATCQDIGQKHAAIVSGTMNMIGNLGGFVVTILTGKILEWSKTNYRIENAIDNSTKLIGNELAAAQLDGYQFNLIMFGLVYMVGAA
jgi:lipoprotein signal peptidase